MQQRIKSALALALLFGSMGLAHGFSLLGPLNANAWQTAALGYGLAGDIGVAVNVNEEYRWNSPYITYAFDQSFLNYFGAEGMQAVEEAISMLNNLPPVSQLSADLSEFPLDNKKVNYSAKAMGVLDLKSTTLTTLLEVMGLAAPERWVYCLRDRQVWTPAGANYSLTNYLVIMRNFDPITYQPTNRVNSAFYGYLITEPILPGNYADAIETPIDSLTMVPYSSVAGANEFGWYSGYFIGGGQIIGDRAGELFTGLTRDDAGGWRYLLRYGNLNVENLPVAVGLIPALTNAANTNIVVTNAVISSYLTNSPWRPYLGSTNSYTNYVYTNYYIYTNPPWTIYMGLTNATTTNTTVTNAAVTNLGTNLLINTGLRPGIEKVVFQRTMFDSYLGQAYRPITNFYTDTTISNFVKVTQQVQRVAQTPDILFAAFDLGTTIPPGTMPVIMRRGANFINNDAINGFNTPHAGPGNIAPPILIAFSDILPGFWNVDGPGYPQPGSGSLYELRTMVWGSFGPTLDTPIVVYPNWVSLQELEQLILNH